MPRTELLDLSAPRAELDRRSREARLRQEQVERLLVVRPLRKQSLALRVVRCFRSRIYIGEQIQGRSADPTLSGTHSGSAPQAPRETSSAAGSFPAAPPAAWSHCMGRGRITLVQSDPSKFSLWQPCCGRTPRA